MIPTPLAEAEKEIKKAEELEEQPEQKKRGRPAQNQK